MASESKPVPSSSLHTCHICQLSVASVASHEDSLQHRAARQIAAAALDRWWAQMAADTISATPVVEDSDAPNETVTFCEPCGDTVPTSSYPRHLTSKAHLVSALKEQVFDEQVRLYVDEEDLKILEDLEIGEVGLGEDKQATGESSKAATKYTCHICALEVPVIFKSYHNITNYHHRRVALATAAARRTSAFLHSTTMSIGLDSSRNIQYTELLKAYTGIDLMENIDVVEEVVEKETEEKASQIEANKRLTAKQYFADILPYLQYTEALYTLIIDDTEFVTIKTTNGAYMRVHVTNFNGVYSTGGDPDCQMKCQLCHGNNNYIAYSSENEHDKLHVMSLGHIRHVLTPIDNIHGIRKIDNGSALCVLCNRYLPEHGVDNHILNDIYHTAFLAEALKRGRTFKENKDDLKIVIYSAPHADDSNYFTRYPLHRNRCFPQNIGFGQSGNVNVCFPHGGSNSFPQVGNVSLPQGGTLFGASNTQSTGFGASNASTGGFGTGTGFGTNTVTIEGFGASSAQGTGFGASNATTPQYSVFGVRPASNTAFGASNAQGTGFGASNTQSTGFGASNASTGVFGARPASNTAFGASNAQGTGFGASNTQGTGFGASNTQSTGFGANNASTGVFGARPANNSAFGASNTQGTAFGASTASNVGFGASSANIAKASDTVNNPYSGSVGLFGSTQNAGSTTKSGTTAAGSIFASGIKAFENFAALGNTSEARASTGHTFDGTANTY